MILILGYRITAGTGNRSLVSGIIGRIICPVSIRFAVILVFIFLVSAFGTSLGSAVLGLVIALPGSIRKSMILLCRCANSGITDRAIGILFMLRCVIRIILCGCRMISISRRCRAASGTGSRSLVPVRIVIGPVSIGVIMRFTGIYKLIADVAVFIPIAASPSRRRRRMIANIRRIGIVTAATAAVVMAALCADTVGSKSVILDIGSAALIHTAVRAPMADCVTAITHIGVSQGVRIGAIAGNTITGSTGPAVPGGRGIGC